MLLTVDARSENDGQRVRGEASDGSRSEMRVLGAKPLLGYAPIMGSMGEPRVITVQNRGRVNLGKLATHDRYFARLESDGTIVLEPAVLIPLSQKLMLDGRDDSPTALTDGHESPAALDGREGHGPDDAPAV